jgi:hypothetical protein
MGGMAVRKNATITADLVTARGMSIKLIIAAPMC